MPDATAKRNLTKALTNLRHLLEPYLLIERHSVAFNQDLPCVLDVTIFQAAIEGSLILDPEDLERDLAPLRRAVSLYRGDFLEGFYVKKALEFDEWALGQREQLRKLMLQALQVLTTHYARPGADLQAAVGYARRWLSLEPWQEMAHRQLMLLLARSRQRSAALAQYETCRQVLAEELGVEPTAETTALYERLKTAEYVSTSLPAETTPFIGREAELAKIHSLLTNPDCRLLTLIGLGGMGKTRLALEAARQIREGSTLLFLNGVVYAPLAGVRAVESLPVAVTNALSLTLSGRLDPSAELLHHLRNQELLLVLDNFEHLLSSEAGETADGSSLLFDILEHCPKVKLLVTSRKALDLMAAWRLDIEGLSYPPTVEIAPDAASTSTSSTILQHDAAQLFLQTAAQVRPNFQLDEEKALAVRRLCQLVAGIPLAIKLAATWLRVMSLARIVAEVETGLDILSTTLRDLPSRQRSMRAIFDHTWNLLSLEEQKIFQALSVFQGGFDEAAALAVTDTSPFLLAGLVDRGLVQVLNAEQGLRYELHELPRQYAAEKLQAQGEMDLVWRRHSAYYLKFVGQQEARLRGGAPQQIINKLQLELDNLRQGWQWAVKEGEASKLEYAISSLSRFYDLTGLFQEGEIVFGRAAAYLQKHFVTTDGEPKPAVQAALIKLWVEQTRLLIRRGLADQAIQIIPQAANLAQQIQNPHLEAIACLQWGEALYFYGEVEASQVQVERALRLAQANELLEIKAEALRYLGISLKEQGNYPEALELFDQSLVCFRQLGDRRGESLALNNLGITARAQGLYSEAQDRYEQALQGFREIGDLWGQRLILNNLGYMLCDQGHYTQAEVVFRQGLQICHETKDLWGESYLLCNLAHILREQGDYLAAQSYYEQSLQVRRQIGAQLQEGETLAEWALLLHQIGNDELAQDYSRQAEQIGRKAGSSDIRALALTHLGHAQAALGRPAKAIKTYQQALALRLELEQPHRAIEIEAGLARAFLDQDDLTQARQHTAKILPYLESDNFYGAREPFRIYLTCYQVLSAAQDLRAHSLLETAHRLLHEWAAKIEDVRLRRSFLENISTHRAIVAEVEQRLQSVSGKRSENNHSPVTGFGSK